MRSRRPTRCSATSGLHGRSKRTRRRQNSKLRPSPPHSVETRRLGPSGQAELGHLDVAAGRRQLLVEDAGRDLGVAAERLAQPLERLAVGDEHERLLAGVTPAGGASGEPGDPGVGRVGPPGELAERAIGRAEEGLQRRAGGEGAADAVGLLPAAEGVDSGRAPHRLDEGQPIAPAGRILDRHADPRGQAADVEPPRRAGAGRKRLGTGEARLDGLVLGEVGGTEQLEETEEAVDVVVEGDGGQQEHVPAEGGDRGDRAPSRASRVPGGTSQPVGLVDHEEVDAGFRRPRRQLGPRHERLEGDHGTAVDVEGVEVGTVVAGHVGEASLVEEDEDLVVLPPQLAQPLDGERLGGDDEAALGPAGADEAAQDEAGLDRLAEAHLVGQEPAHRVAGGGPLGGVELVGEEADAAAEEGAEAEGLAALGEVQGVEAQREVLDRVDVAPRPASRRGRPGRRWGRGRPGRAGRARPRRRPGAACLPWPGTPPRSTVPRRTRHGRPRAPGCDGE